MKIKEKIDEIDKTVVESVMPYPRHFSRQEKGLSGREYNPFIVWEEHQNQRQSETEEWLPTRERRTSP